MAIKQGNNNANEEIVSNKNKMNDVKETDNNKVSTKKKKKSSLYYFGKLLAKIGITILVVYLLFTYVFGLFRMSGNNMFPAIRDGDLLLTYRLESYVVGDVVAYKTDESERIGRIIGIPGDEIIITELGELQVNGMIPAEEVFYPTTSETTKLEFPYIVPNDSYFILNDYRSDELDSRTYEAISKDRLDGKAMTILRRRGF